MYTAGWTTQSCEEIKIFESSKVCHAAAHKKKEDIFQKQYEKVNDCPNSFPFAILFPQC